MTQSNVSKFKISLFNLNGDLDSVYNDLHISFRRKKNYLFFGVSFENKFYF